MSKGNTYVQPWIQRPLRVKNELTFARREREQFSKHGYNKFRITDDRRFVLVEYYSAETKEWLSRDTVIQRIWKTAPTDTTSLHESGDIDSGDTDSGDIDSGNIDSGDIDSGDFCLLTSSSIS